MSRFLLVIPCYRERARLPAFLADLAGALSDTPLAVSICVVDDGSGSDEAEWLRAHVESFRPQFPALLPPVLSSHNLGKGGAIYLGWSLCRDTEWVAFADADGATSAREVLRVLHQIERDAAPAAAYFASRIKMLGRTVERRLVRHLTGRIFATAASNLLGLPVYDSQCGFKVIRRAAYDEIAPRLREQRFCFDVDLLLQLRLAGHTVREVPVDWEDKDGSKVSLVRDSLAMARSLLKLRRVVAEARRVRPETSSEPER